jgi:hypothetical protein
MRLIMLALCACASGCIQVVDPCVMTTDFAMVTVTITQSDGHPALGLSPWTTLVATNERLLIAQPVGLPPGVYVVVDDSQAHRLSEHGDMIRFSTVPPGFSAPPQASGDYTIGSMGCDRAHVVKLSGPDALVVQ